MKYLVDTNIFLEILLGQNKKEECKEFLESNKNQIYISDFSLHSIGVIPIRLKKFEIFKDFIADIEDNIEILSLATSRYISISEYGNNYSLDFDDAYQLCIAEEFDLIIKTQDNDFRKVTDRFRIEFISSDN